MPRVSYSSHISSPELSMGEERPMRVLPSGHDSAGGVMPDNNDRSDSGGVVVITVPGRRKHLLA